MRRLAVLALFLVAACGSIGVQAQTLKLAYKPGETYKYGFHAVLKYTVGASGFSIPLDLDMSAKETMTVKSVDSTGTAVVTVAVTDLTVKTTANGVTNTTTTTTSTSVDMKIASDGRIVSINGNAFGSNSLPGTSGSQGLLTAILPDGAVKPGDTWTKNYDVPNPVGSGTSHVTTDNKYLRDEKVGNVNTAVIESKIKGTIDLTIDTSSAAGGGSPLFPSGGASGMQGLSMKGTTTSDVTTWFDAGAHRVVKSHSSGDVDATMSLNMAAGSTTPGLTGPITIKGTQTLDMTPA